MEKPFLIIDFAVKLPFVVAAGDYTRQLADLADQLDIEVIPKSVISEP